MKVETDAEAEDYIRECGGRLFVWVSDAGLEHETTKPKEGIDFIELRGDGFSLYVDPAIEMPARWSLVFRSLPTSPGSGALEWRRVEPDLAVDVTLGR